MKVVINGFFENVVLAAFAASMLIAVHWELGVVLAVWTCLFLTGIVPLARRLNRLSENFAGDETATTGLFVDTYTNIGTVKVYGNIGRQESELHSQIERESQSFKKLGRWEVLLFHFQGISGILLSLSLTGGAYFLFLKGAIGVGDLVFTLGVTLKLFWTVWEMGPHIANYNRNYGECLQGLSDILVPRVLEDPKE